MTDQVRFLNPVVQAEVEANPLLSAAWTTTYDDEIDPLHNPDWVEAQKDQEYKTLSVLKARLSRSVNVELCGVQYKVVGEARVRIHPEGGDVSTVVVHGSDVNKPHVNIQDPNPQPLCLVTLDPRSPSGEGYLQLLPGDRVIVLRARNV